MNTSERREKILDIITRSKVPVSGSALASECGVSRQIIVSDIAALKEKNDIIATSRGYVLQKPYAAQRVVKVVHTDDEIEDEFMTVINLGGKIRNVFVWHKIYGKIEAPLEIEKASDAAEYLESLKSGRSMPLKRVTSEYHYHLIEADSEKTLDKIEEALRNKKYLVEEQTAE